MQPLLFIGMLFIGGIIGTAIAYFIFYKKIKLPQIQKNEEIFALNEQWFKENDVLRELHDSLTKAVSKANNDLADKQKEILQAAFKLEETKIEAQNAKEEFLKTNLELAQNELDKRLEEASEKYQVAEDAYLKEYLGVMADMVHEAEDTIKEKREEYEKISDEVLYQRGELSKIQNVINAATEAHKLEMAESSKKDFHRLQLTSDDLEEINTLKTVVPKMRDPLALNKAIWKVYYEKPYMALIGRVIGASKKMGIYKITNIKNNMSYVGQAVDVAERWKQHIKRGIGAEAPTKNKLYPAMLQEGVENFTFELLTECSKEELNEQEDYYQELFHCKDYGYSIK